MAVPPQAPPRHAPDLTRPLSGAGGGLSAYAVTGHPALMAIQAPRAHSPRLRALQKLTFQLETVLLPVSHGPAPALPEPHATAKNATGYFIVTPAPPGPAIGAILRSWREAEILDHVLKPIALALETLHGAGITHRAINPDNVFQAGPGRPVVLGAAWAAPAGLLQPALFEPPDSALCLPAGRGDGSPADDVYALGVLLLTLALGRLPLAGMSDTEILARKIERGSYAALSAEERLPPGIAELTRGMLAEDPDHRPSAALLLDPAAARARRLAARPSRRAQRPLDIGGMAVWNARQAAHALALQPTHATAALRGGRMDHWLRHGLGDATLAARLDEVVRHRHIDGQPADPGADALLATRAIALLDPLAPLCWQGIALWPDGIGPALAAAMADPAQAGTVQRITDLVAAQAQAAWGRMRPERCDAGLLRMEARQMSALLRISGMTGGVRRLRYQLNPLQACASPLLGGHHVARVHDLLPALNDTPADPGVARPIDPEIAAFIAARADRRLEAEIAMITGQDADAGGALAQLRLFAELQSSFHPQPVPALAGWLAARSGALALLWHNRQRRAQTAERMKTLAEAGMIAPMLRLIEDHAARDADAEAARRAAVAVARIDATLLGLRDGVPERGALAVRLGQEIAAGAGLATLAGVLIMAALG